MLKNDVEQFSERVAQLARRDEGAGKAACDRGSNTARWDAPPENQGSGQSTDAHARLLDTRRNPQRQAVHNHGSGRLALVDELDGHKRTQSAK